MSSTKPTRHPRSAKPRVLVVENDPDVLANLAWQLRRPQEQVEVVRAMKAVDRAVNAAVDRAVKAVDPIEVVQNTETSPDAVVIDLGLEGSEEINKLLQVAGVAQDDSDSVGHRLARKLYEVAEGKIPLFGCSGEPKRYPKSKAWFREKGYELRPFGVYDKYLQFAMLKHHLYEAIGVDNIVKVFIVHSVGTPRLREFEQLATDLGFEPEVLDKQHWQNEGWLHSIEYNAEEVALAWILCTPDDWAFKIREPEKMPVRQPRQNVVFEHGFFFGRFGRHSDRVFVFQCDGAALPGDVKHLRSIAINESLTDKDTRNLIIEQLHNWLPVRRV
jgi:CheY-like chemotaxis protein